MMDSFRDSSAGFAVAAPEGVPAATGTPATEKVCSEKKSASRE